MKKTNQIVLIALLAVGVVACTNKTTAERTSAYQLKEFVDSINRADLDYTQENWVMIDNGYQERALRAEAEVANMNDEDKAELVASKASYAELNARYEIELEKRKMVVNSKTTLRNTLFGEGKVGEDMTFSFANANNILSIYQTFVDAVDVNQKNYSREDWDEIKLLYEALDTRKNVVEKELPNGHNGKISTFKMKFATIYDRNRPGSKAEENSDAKK